MAFTDRILKCRDCEQNFNFTAGEQEFYNEKGFEREPLRCRECRDAKKREREELSGGPKREMHETTCCECGKVTFIPFKPRYERPIYCRDCFIEQRIKLSNNLE